MPDSHADLVRNPGYWDASQIHIANFTVQAITEPEQILAALQSGQVNVAYIAGNQVAAAKAAGFKVAVIPSEVVNELDIQTTTAPFNNPDVVKAINYAINRQAILQVQASGYGAVSYQPFPKGFVGYSSKLANQYPYNPAHGQAAAGPGRVHERAEDHADRRRATDDSLAEQIQGQLAQVGITATIGNISADTETQYLYLDKTIPFAVDGTAGRMSPVEMLDVLYSQQGLMNVDGKAGDHARRGDPALRQRAHRPARPRRVPDRAAERGGDRGPGRPHPHLALHQPAHLRLQPDGDRHTVGPGAAALGRRPGGELTRWCSHRTDARRRGRRAPAAPGPDRRRQARRRARRPGPDRRC